MILKIFKVSREYAGLKTEIFTFFNMILCDEGKLEKQFK